MKRQMMRTELITTVYIHLLNLELFVQFAVQVLLSRLFLPLLLTNYTSWPYCRVMSLPSSLDDGVWGAQFVD
jgi:uncharacterized membrane protein affecting hemolysin expression